MTVLSKAMALQERTDPDRLIDRGKPGVPSGLSIQKSFLGMPIDLGANLKLGNGSEMWDQIRDGQWSKLRPKLDLSLGIMATLPTDNGRWRFSGGVSAGNLGGKPDVRFELKGEFESNDGKWGGNVGVGVDERGKLFIRPLTIKFKR